MRVMEGNAVPAVQAKLTDKSLLGDPPSRSQKRRRKEVSKSAQNHQIRKSILIG